MNERLLQYIWHRQLFSASSLCTTDGEFLEVIDRGIWNHDQGPDFLGALIRLSGMTWAGNVELHVQTRDWVSHGHQHDPGYDNVMLHVVWEHTGTIDPQIPVLELKNRIPIFMLETYMGWMQQLRSVPCEDTLDRRSQNTFGGGLGGGFLVGNRPKFRTACQRGRLRGIGTRTDSDDPGKAPTPDPATGGTPAGAGPIAACSN